jgi:hypothetical protein
MLDFSSEPDGMDLLCTDQSRNAFSFDGILVAARKWR